MICPDPKLEYLLDLSFVGEPTEAMEPDSEMRSYAIVGEAKLRDDGSVDLKATWEDFKWDLARCKEAGIRTIFAENKAPDPGEDTWIIALNPSTIPTAPKPARSIGGSDHHATGGHGPEDPPRGGGVGETEQ